MEFTLLYEIVVTFLLSIVVTILCSRFKLPATVGFLLTGVLCGPSLLGVVSDRSVIEHVAEIGVAMLLFTIGMELSGEALNRLKRPVFLGGSLQIGLTVVVISFLTLLQGEEWHVGIFWGCLVALSSSAIVLRLLQDQGVTSTPTGRLTLAILVFQDIMVAPMLLCVPLLSGTLDLTLKEALFSCLKVALILGGVIVVANLGLNRFMEIVMRTRTREILLLTILGLCLGMALLTSALGLSLSLGAFLAGLLLARSQYSMSIISGILPYRDVFMSLFFISVGMLLDVDFFCQNIWFILFNTVLFVITKALLTLPAVIIQGYPLRVAITAALSLAQVGEFSFVLAASGLAANLFGVVSYQEFLAMSVLTMMLTPALIAIAPRLADAVARWRNELGRETQEEKASLSEHALEDHLIIIGFGINGKHLAHVARESGIKYRILEMNPETVRRYRDKEPISHGDATQPVVLEHLGVDKARVLAIIISSQSAVREITLEARKINPNIHIVARTRFVTEMEPLHALGADEVIAEEFESSIEVFNRVLAQYLVPRQDIDMFASKIRQANYRMLRHMKTASGQLDDALRRMPDMGVQAMRVEKNSKLCGVSLGQSDLRPKYKITVVAIKRGEDIDASPTPDTIFEHGDIVYIFGKTDKLLAVKPIFGNTLS